MNKLAASLQVFFIVTTGYGQPVQLAPPLMNYQSVFFKDTAMVALHFDQQATKIHYTLDNSLPTEKSKIYSGPIQIKNQVTTLKAITSSSAFLSSDAVSVTFIKDGLKIKSIQQPAANERYPGNGPGTLKDNEGGTTDLNSTTWLGYRQDSVEIIIELEERQKLSSVLIHCLQDHNGWIFLPAITRVYYFDDNKNAFVLIAEQTNTSNKIVQGASCVPVLIPLQKKATARKIKIILRGIESLPEEHPGKGQPGWLFIDEIKLY